MFAVPSDHHPGAVALITGEQFRFAQSARCAMTMMAPAGSALAWPMGVLVAHNINLAFQSVLDNPALQWCFLMGDDHTYPPDIIPKLLDRNVDAVIPLCLNRAPPIEPTIAVRMDDGRHRFKLLSELPGSGIYRLADNETCGDAGLLIRRHVLEKIGAPWHLTKKSGAHDAEDREFTERIKDHGFSVHVDLDNPIGHIAPTVLSPVRYQDQWNIRLEIAGKPVCNLAAAT